MCLLSLPFASIHPHSTFTYEAHLLSPPMFDLLSLEDPEIPISSNDSSVNRECWVPINTDELSNYPSHRLSIDWTFSHLDICLCFYYNPNTHNTTHNTNQSPCVPLHRQWGINNILKAPEDGSWVSTIKY